MLNKNSQLKYRSFFLLVVLLVTASVASAQKREVIYGSLNGLKAQKSYDITFTYDSMFVGMEIPEKRYLEDKRKAWEEKEPGKGDAFVQQWYDARKKLYEPTFIKSFEKFALVKLNDKNAKYTMILKTYHTEAGWNIGVATHPGEIGGELWIVESADTSKIIAIISLFECLGTDPYGGDFEMTRRIQSAYASAGKWLGEFVRRKAK
jgi:hypothetical protein